MYLEWERGQKKKIASFLCHQIIRNAWDFHVESHFESEVQIFVRALNAGTEELRAVSQC